jgi:hypothetical protein
MTAGYLAPIQRAYVEIRRRCEEAATRSRLTCGTDEEATIRAQAFREALEIMTSVDPEADPGPVE